ncbi:MAG: hypothetical protein ACLFO1_02560, partial [Spirochaetaceae bacterium]
MKQQRVCITGGSGFLGTHPVREITEGDSPIPASEIIVYDPSPPPAEIAGKVRHVAGDIRDRAGVKVLILTSSLDATFSGKELVDVDE